MPDNPSYRDQQLLQRLALGDELAMKRLFHLYRGRLFRYISGFVKSRQVAEELVMDVFMKMWIGRGMVTRIDNVDAFLFRIARNKSIDFLRAAAGDPQLKELLWAGIQAYAGENPHDSLVMQEYEQKLQEGIGLLPPQRKTAYLLRRELDFTHEQIASQMGLSRSTVNNHIVEAQKFLRSFLARNMDLGIVLLMLDKL